jgi:uncharacterized protein YukE
VAIVPAAADEISGAIAQAFSAQGQQWQQASAVAQDLYQRFVLATQASAAAYQQAETEIAGWLRGLGSLFMRALSGPRCRGCRPMAASRWSRGSRLRRLFCNEAAWSALINVDRDVACRRAAKQWSR